ncbi:MAG: DDE-type integrase/transposase/recombinase, partial [Candidatus Thermoplasmatota archaeon]
AMSEYLIPQGAPAPSDATLAAAKADPARPTTTPETAPVGAQPMPTTAVDDSSPAPWPAATTTTVEAATSPTPAESTPQPMPETDSVEEVDVLEEQAEEADRPPGRPSLCGRTPGWQRRKPKTMKPQAAAEGTSGTMTPEQRLLLLDTWKKSGLPGLDFGALVGVSKHTLYAWKKKFDENGPAGLVDKPSGRKAGSRLSDLTKRAILMMKEANPEWGVQRISDMLLRGPALYASPSAVARVLHEAGYVYEETTTHPHPDHIRSFERAKPNELWQTDLFTFMLKRQNRRVHLVGFMDDHSRFMVAYGLHATASTALVIEVLRAGIVSYGPATEVLTDNGSQYVTWRGKSAFTKELEKRGIQHIRSARKHPQTLGKIERFWGTLWKECIESAVFVDLEDARK